MLVEVVVEALTTTLHNVELPSLSLGDVDAGLDESEWMDRPAELDGGGEVESEGIRPSFMRFFCFIRLFWNHIWCKCKGKQRKNIG